MSTDPARDQYNHLDANTLTYVLTDPGQSADDHQKALNAMLRIRPDERRSRLVIVIRKMIQVPDSYDDEVKLALVEALATDPHPGATAAMLQVLPDILAEAMSERRALPDEFREYFYQALTTRSREDDLEVWRETMPQLEPPTLVAMLLDPAGESLVVALEPLELISRLAEPERSRALVSAIVGMARLDGRDAAIETAAMLIHDGSGDPPEHAIEMLAERWSRAQRAGNERSVANIERALRIIDRRPRTRVERLTGRRPWAE